MTPTKAAITGLCAYEIAAVTTGKVPTLTQIFRAHRVAEIVFLGWMAVHLHRPDQSQVA